MIDTHSHIYDTAFDIDRDEVVNRGFAAGVEAVIMPAIDSQTHEKMFDAAKKYNNHYVAIGVHPTSVKADYKREIAIAKEYLEKERKSIVGIGEIGLDLYWDKTYLKEQIVALNTQFEWAIEHNLPAIVHTRDAFGEMINLMSDYKGSPLRVLFHAFGGTILEAETLLSYGNHLLGVGGVVTYKRSVLADVVREIDLDRLVLETDAPYLTPVPHRGKRNESSYMTLVAQFVAAQKGISIERVCEKTTQNSKLFFNI